jgi:hypothetical protein
MHTHDYLHWAVIIVSLIGGLVVCAQIWRWHKEPNNFDLRDLIMAPGKNGKGQFISRAAVGEMVALAATTSGYLGSLAVKPEAYADFTAVFGSLWAVRGGFSTYLRSKQK